MISCLSSPITRPGITVPRAGPHPSLGACQALARSLPKTLPPRLPPCKAAVFSQQPAASPEAAGGPDAARAAAAAPQPFLFAVLQAPLMGAAQELPPHLQAYAARLEGLGGWLAPPAPDAAAAGCAAAREAAEAGVPLVLFVGTGGTEPLALQAAEVYYETYATRHERAAAGLPPLLLAAHPFGNSLPAALEILAKLQQDGRKGRIVYLPSSEERCTSGGSEWCTLEAALKAAGVWLELHAARIGLVGQPSPWLVASAPPPEAVRASWGPLLVDVPMEEFEGPLRADKFDPELVEQVVHDVRHGGPQAGGCARCEPAQAAPAAKTYIALRGVVDAHSLRCLSVRCFDIVTDLHTTGCYALARLLDEGVVAGCEGDVCTTLGMLWGRLMTGCVPWMGNVAQVDVQRNSLTLAHCTVARSLLSTCQTNTHFESGLGVAIQGQMPPGPATLLRIGGRRLDRLWVEEGEVSEALDLWSPHLCRTQVHIQLAKGGNAVERLLSRPLGNHLVLLRGHHRAALEAYWREFGPGGDP